MALPLEVTDRTNFNRYINQWLTMI